MDRLKQVEVYAGGAVQDTAVYDYDYTGERVSKTVDGANRRRTFNRYFESQSGYKTLYFYAGDQMIGSWVVPDGGIFSEVPPGTPIPSERWVPPSLPSPVVWGLGAFVLLLLVGPGRRPIRIGVALPVARVLATTAVFVVTASPLGCVLACGPPGGGGPDPVWRDYHGDHLGSTQVLTDINGNLVHHVRYQAYGEIRGPFNGSGGIVQPDEMERWQFTGYESEAESKLQYAGARYYDPELAQFLTHDPASQFASPYAYGPWDPMNGTDPTGAVFGFDDLIIWTVVIALAAALDTYLQTGDIGTAATSFGISLATSFAAIGAGFVVGQAIAASGVTSLQTGFKVAMTGYGAYGVGQSFSEGRYFSAVASGAMMVHAAHAANTEDGTPPGEAADGGGETGGVQLARGKPDRPFPGTERPHHSGKGSSVDLLKGALDAAGSAKRSQANRILDAMIERLRYLARRHGLEQDAYVYKEFKYGRAPEGGFQFLNGELTPPNFGPIGFSPPEIYNPRDPTAIFQYEYEGPIAIHPPRSEFRFPGGGPN